MPIYIPHINIFGRGFKLQVAITIACQCAFVLFGYDQGVFGGIVGNENFLAQFGHPNASLEGIIVSIYNLGAFSGCILAFFICDITGRRLAMWIAMCFIIVGAILQASAFTVPHLMVARYITGIGTGKSTSLLPWEYTMMTLLQESRPQRCPCTNPNYAKPENEADLCLPNHCSSV